MSTYPATNSREATELVIDSGNQLHEIVNEDATTEVLTESGYIPSVRKALADTFLFQDPIPWQQGSDETAFNQLRTFNGDIYWAPTATTLNPIPMGVTPVGDSNWGLAPVNPRGYRGLWPDTGGGALKGETWQTQVGGVPTGSYYTALQNTSVDPVGDNVNWKAQNDYGDLAIGLSVRQTRGSNAQIMTTVLEDGRIVKNDDDSSIHMGDGVTLGGVKHVNVNMTDIVFKNDQFSSAEGNMVLGQIDGKRVIQHKEGNIYLAHNVSYRCNTDNPTSLSDFTNITNTEPKNVQQDNRITAVENRTTAVENFNDSLMQSGGAALVGASSGSSVQSELDALSNNQQSGVIVFTTFSLLDAYTPTAAEERASFKVTNDPDSSKNGYYSWVSGTTYVQDESLVTGVIDENNTSDAVSGKAVHDFVVDQPRLYSDVLQYSDVGNIQRIVMPFRFVQGQSYKVQVSFNDDFTSPATAAFSLRTVESNLYTDIVDEIFAYNGTVSKETKVITFTASNDATYYYIYVNSTTAVTINLTIDELTYIPAMFNKDAVSALIPKSYDLYNNYNASPQRFVIKHQFKAGVKYDIAVNFDTLGSVPSGYDIIYAFKTTSSDSYLDVVDDVIELSQPSILSKQLLFSFTASAGAPFLYTYINMVEDVRFTTSITSHEEVDANSAHLANVYNTLNKFKSSGSYQYSGNHVDLKRHGYDYSSLISLQKPAGETNSYQGCDIYDGKLFTCFHTGAVAVYDYGGSAAPIASFNLGSYGTDNHANCANFSNVFYPGNTQFPLLYVTGGNDINTMRCEVENIVESGGVYSSTKVQSITFDQTGFAAAGLEEIWGWPNWMVDAEKGYLYVFTSKYRSSDLSHFDDNIYIANKFKIPDPTIGDITIGLSDLVEQKTFEFNVHYTQSGTIFDDKLIYVFGLGSSTYPFEIRVYDLSSDSLSSSISVPVTHEPESCFVKDGLLNVLMVDGEVLTFDFK